VLKAKSTCIEQLLTIIEMKNFPLNCYSTLRDYHQQRWRWNTSIRAWMKNLYCIISELQLLSCLDEVVSLAYAPLCNRNSPTNSLHGATDGNRFITVLNW